MAFITYPLNGIEYNAENAETYLCTRKSGVYSSDEHFSPQVTGEREITITPGLAWIQNAEFSGKSVVSTENVPIAVPVADGSLPRIDRIVLRFDKAANASSIVLKQGTPATPAVAPAVTQTELVYELGLCTVAIPASSLSISAADVTDTRLDEAVCGLMRDGVTGIPTSALEAQANALLEELRNAISQIEAGSGVMLVTTYGGSANGVVKSADRLQTPRKIGNASFDGTKDVTLAQMGITLSELGAQPARLTFTGKTVATSAWASDAAYADYPYRAAVACAGVTAESFADVVLGPEDAAGGNFAPVCMTYAGGLYLYAKAVPDATLTIPTIVVWR